MTDRLYVDFETRSELDVRDVGTYKYVNHPSTQPICMSWALNDGGIKTHNFLENPTPPQEVSDALQSGAVFVAHNSAFDAGIWDRLPGVVKTSLDRTIDTSAKCRAFNIPGSLGSAAEFLNLTFRKMTTGKILVSRLSSPKSVNPTVWDEDPRAVGLMLEYNAQDVIVLRELDRRVPDLSESEQNVWKFDQIINTRGIGIDRDFCLAGNELVEAYKVELDKEIGSVTNGAVQKVSQVARLTEWVKKQGVNVESIGKSDIIDLLEKGVPEQVKTALEIRRAYAKSSASKLATMLECLNGDERVRNQFLYHGAGTGRWSGRLGQFQNLPRFPKELKAVREVIFKALKSWDMEGIKQAGMPVTFAVSSVLRAVICASTGNRLYGGDFSSIEARALAWLADQKDLVDRFANNEDVYLYTAARIYRRNITKADEKERMIGKVATLALGYQGGANAFTKMAINYGVRIPEKEARQIVRDWREANHKIVEYWYSVERASVDAMEFAGKTVGVGPKGRRVAFCFKNGNLMCRIPSGRILYYPQADLETRTVFGKRVKQTSYMGEVATKKGMFRISQYGGKLVENITQAVARDCMVEAALQHEKSGYHVVATIHDEILSETPDNFGSLDEFTALMTAPIPWAENLPLAVEAWTGHRYWK